MAMRGGLKSRHGNICSPVNNLEDLNITDYPSVSSHGDYCSQSKGVFFCGFSFLQVPIRKPDPRHARRRRRLLRNYLFVNETSRNLYLNSRRINRLDELFTFAGLFRKSSCVWIIEPFSRCRFFDK